MRNKALSLLLPLLLLILAACTPAATDIATGTPAPPGITLTDTPALATATPAGLTITPTLCPQATPEWLRVRPVTSPTSELTQTILVDINNGEWVRITTASGTFEGRPGRGSSDDGFFPYNFIVEIDLLPDTTHELTVVAKIREIEQSGCTYGGYTLSTTRDIDGNPLTIVQEPASQTITPTLCPQATPEWLRVRPVTSPTSELTQTILVDINNGEWVRITTASGTFEGRPGRGSSDDGFFPYNFIVEIDLLPDTTHELTVEAKIREIEQSGCTYGGYTLSTTRDIDGNPLTIVQEPASQTITPTLCPQATPEWLRVRPVTSPTSELTQTILVDINNGEWVRITTASGTFEGRPGRGSSDDGFFPYNFIVEIDLLPDTTHELTVEAKIREIEQSGCTYGGYTLSTTTDINGDPLTIVQE